MAAWKGIQADVLIERKDIQILVAEISGRKIRSLEFAGLSDRGRRAEKRLVCHGVLGGRRDG